jgi:hypothetical protein
MKVSIEEKFNCVMNNDNHDGARPDHPDVFLIKILTVLMRMQRKLIKTNRDLLRSLQSLGRTVVRT